MNRCVFGVIGHVDHGKTALVRALTGIETDRLPEEKRRGISIALGFAHFAEGDATVDLIDMPGHERFVRTMVSGATGIDAALLVVAANEGIKPQTVEHVEIAGLLGLRRAVVAISKTDLVAADAVQGVAADIGALLRRVGVTAEPAIPVSVHAPAGIERLRAALVAAAAAPREAEGLAFMPIDRAFSVAGHGTVVTGTLRGAALAPGDTLTLWPGERLLRLRAVQVHGARVARATPGQRVALNLRDAEVAEVRPGAMLAAPGSLSPSRWLSVALRAVAGAPPLANAARLRALVGTAEIDVRLRLLDRDVLEPGAACLAQLHGREPFTVPAREKLILRLPSPPRTVAGGSVIEPETLRRPRHSAPVIQRLTHLASLTPAEIVVAEAERAGPAGTSLAHLSRLTALPPARVKSLLTGALVSRDGMVVQLAALEALGRQLRTMLARQEWTREALGLALPNVGPAVLDETLARLVAAGIASDEQGRIGERRPEVARDRARAEAALCAELADTLRRGGLAPPDIAPVAERKRALDRLIREGIVIRAPDPAQKRVVLFHQDAIEEARRRLLPLLSQPLGLSVSEVGAALQISRKYSVPLLEHLDAIRFTRRVQDRRILMQARAGV